MAVRRRAFRGSSLGTLGSWRDACRDLAFVAVLVLAAGCDRDAVPPTLDVGTPPGHRSETPVLRAPASDDEGDLDLHLHWRAARVRQRLRASDSAAAFRQFPELVVLEGAGHRALLLLPSADRSASLASFRVEIPTASECELVTWVAIAAAAGAKSDGVEIGIAVGESDPETLPIQFARLAGTRVSTAWHELRVDLSPHVGRTVWVVFAARDRKDPSHDWLLWGDPRIRPKAPASPSVVDLGTDAARRHLLRLPWSEANVFKTYTVFNDDAAAAVPPEWLRLGFPWLESLRLFSSLGANWGPSLERDYEAQMGRNPTANSRWEAQWARQYEFFRDGDGWRAAPVRDCFDWGAIDALNERAVSAGLALHLHMAGAPERFTGNQGSYPSYHYNELEVVDGEGWREYVDALFAHLSGKPWFGDAHVSFFSEPNCMWIEFDGRARHLGFHGAAEDYARQYLWTWQAKRPYLASGQGHLGPWVVEPDPGNPVLDNLPGYLRAIKEAFANAAEPLPLWSAFAFNLYETPQLTLDGFERYKLRYVRRLLAEEFPDRPLPIRLDEFGLHPLIADTFEKSVGERLEAARWAMAWHAEMLALLVEQGIQQAGSWLPLHMQFKGQDFRAYAAYVFLSFVVHGVALDLGDGDTVDVLAAPPGSSAPPDVSVRLASQHADRIGYLASSDEGSGHWRIAVWHYPSFMASDRRLDREPAQLVELRLPGAADTPWKVTITGYEDQSFAGIEGPSRVIAFDRFPKLPRLRRTETQAVGRVGLTLGPADLYLVETERQSAGCDHIDAEPPSAGAGERAQPSDGAR